MYLCRGKGEETRKEEHQALPPAAGNARQLVMPEDGYEWKKYGQKFIKNIRKNRSIYVSYSGFQSEFLVIERGLDLRAKRITHACSNYILARWF
jgi:hypothetical protein